MSTLYLLVDSTGLIVSVLATEPQTWSAGLTLIGIPNTLLNAQEAQNAPSGTYLYINGAIIRKPWFTVAGGGGTLTATLEAYTSTTMPAVTFVVGGQTFTATAATDATTGVITASTPLTVDASAQMFQIPVTISADGFVTLTVNIGGTQPNPIKTVLVSGSAPTVVPANVADYQAYLFSQFPNLYVALQMAAATQHLSYDMHRIACAGLTAGMTANQQTTFNDLTTNLFPDLVLTLETAQTTSAALYGQVKSSILHFASLQGQMNAALTNWYSG